MLESQPTRAIAFWLGRVRLNPEAGLQVLSSVLLAQQLAALGLFQQNGTDAGFF